jgi:hypothetical protein
VRRLDGKRLRRLLQISRVELAQVSRHALLDLSNPALNLRTREVLVAVVDRLELAAIDGDARLCQQTNLSAQRHKLRTYLADRSPVILAEIGNRLVLGNQATDEPHDFNVAASLTLKSPARLNPVEVTVDVELEQHRRMVRRSAGDFRINPVEPQIGQIELIHKYVDHTDRRLSYRHAAWRSAMGKNVASILSVAGPVRHHPRSIELLAKWLRSRRGRRS